MGSALTPSGSGADDFYRAEEARHDQEPGDAAEGAAGWNGRRFNLASAEDGSAVPPI